VLSIPGRYGTIRFTLATGCLSPSVLVAVAGMLRHGSATANAKTLKDAITFGG